MNIDDIVKFAEFFFSLSKTLNSGDILGKLEEMETYSERKKHAEDNFKHLSSGSSRIVYLLTPGDFILKLAKNEKGIAQNRAENAISKMKSKYINSPIDHAKNFAWIKSPFLEKITAKQFEKITGFNFDQFGDCLKFSLKNVSGSKNLEKPDNYEKISSSEIFKELTEIGKKFKLMPGDIARISSWGKSKKGDYPVLIDAGLTKKIFEDFYEK